MVEGLEHKPSHHLNVLWGQSREPLSNSYSAITRVVRSFLKRPTVFFQAIKVLNFEIRIVPTNRFNIFIGILKMIFGMLSELFIIMQNLDLKKEYK